MAIKSLFDVFGNGQNIDQILYDLANQRGGRMENVVEGDGEGGQRTVQNYNFNGQDYWALRREAEAEALRRSLPADILAEVNGMGIGINGPVNYGPGSEVLRDAQGRPLGVYQVEGSDGLPQNRYLPWDILQKYPQLGGTLGTQYHETPYGLKEFLTDPGTLSIFATAAGGALAGGAGAGAEGALNAGAGAFDAAGMAGLESGFGIGGAGMGGTAGAAANASAGGTGGEMFLDPWDLMADPFTSYVSPEVMSYNAASNPLGWDLDWADTLDRSLIGPDAGALPGSGSQFAPMSSAQMLNLAKSGAGLANSILGNKALGAGLGALAGMFGGSKPAGNITTVEDIPEWTKPSAYAGLADMNAAFAMTPYRSPVTMAGEDYYGDVIRGDYLRPETNPYIEDVYNKAAGKTSAGVNALFSKGGRYGSGAHQGVLGETLGNLATDIYGQNYARERGYQQQLAMDSDDFGTASILQPFRRGQALLGGATSVRGGSSSAPYFRNRAGEVLAGALGGSRLLS